MSYSRYIFRFVMTGIVFGASLMVTQLIFSLAWGRSAIQSTQLHLKRSCLNLEFTPAQCEQVVKPAAERINDTLSFISANGVFTAFAVAIAGFLVYQAYYFTYRPHTLSHACKVPLVGPGSLLFPLFVIVGIIAALQVTGYGERAYSRPALVAYISYFVVGGFVNRFLLIRIRARDRGGYILEQLANISQFQEYYCDRVCPKDRDDQCTFRNGAVRGSTASSMWRPCREPTSQEVDVRPERRIGPNRKGVWSLLRSIENLRGELDYYAKNWSQNLYRVYSIYDHIALDASTSLKDEYTFRADIYHGTGSARVAVVFGTLTAMTASFLLHVVEIRMFTVASLVAVIFSTMLMGVFWLILHANRRESWYALSNTVVYGLRSWFTRPAPNAERLQMPQPHAPAGN